MCLFFSFYISYSNIKRTISGNFSLCFCDSYHWNNAHKIFQYVLETIMACLVPFIFINIFYSSVICRLKSAKFQQRSQGSRLILLIICAFAIFWLPYHIVNIIEVIISLFFFYFMGGKLLISQETRNMLQTGNFPIDISVRYRRKKNTQ